MASGTKTFRIFVSSTFSDLKAERNALQQYVFPRLRDLCAQHGCRFGRSGWWRKPFGTRSKGRWASEPTARCASCGVRFAAPPSVVDAIRTISLNANVLPDRSPCVALPSEAWDDPRLGSECPQCRHLLRFNPFVVDFRGRARNDERRTEN